MEQSIITFQANEQELVKTGGADKFASSTVAYVEAHFELGTNWDSFDSVRAMWRFGSDVMATVLAIENGVGVCQVPHELLEKRGELKVNLVGSIVEDEVISDRLTTYPIVALIITKVAMVTSDETEVTPSQFEQFVAIVKDDADRAEDARDDAESAESNASQSAEDADIARIKAEDAQNSAEIAQGKAEDAQEEAERLVSQIQDLSAQGVQLLPSETAYASYNAQTGILTIGIPQGVQGVQGEQGEKGDKGDKGATGATGATGNGIASITLLSTVGAVKTYRITYTNGEHFDFEVTDGEVTEEELDDKTRYTSINLYDSSLQTPDTISPHYYVDGVPYSNPSFDSSWNCTALFNIEPSTQYTIGLVPPYGDDTVKPWGGASYGAFFYTEDGTYISGSNNNTFTTPSNAKQMRFNYWIGGGITLARLNAMCMLVKGDTLPIQYEAYYDYYVKEKIAILENSVVGNPINYIFDNDGEGITLISKYNKDYDIVIELRKKGGNDLFDFDKVGIIPNDSKNIVTSTDGISYIIPSSGDWHSPFTVQALQNGDGDNPTSNYFTGGNHQYNNQGTGSTATARTTSLLFLADKMEVTSGSGSCSRFEMMWTNLVQAYNTTKADGSGREVLQENHRLIFDGVRFEDFTDLLPLEDVLMKIWYGLQWFTDPYPKVRYIGGANREEYVVADAYTKSGDSTCCHAVGYGTEHEIRVDIDANYDLGDRKFFPSNADNAMLTATYGKGYCFVINGYNLYEDDMYSLHGWYQFMPHN